MKILHIVENISPRYGGMAQACKDICRSLALAGEEATIYAVDRDVPEGRLDVPVDVPVIQDGYTVWYFPVQFSPYVVSIHMARALRRHAKEFDLIHIHGVYRFPQAIAAYYARRNGIPYIVSPHGSLDPFMLYRRTRQLRRLGYQHLVVQRLLNNASAVQYTSEEEMILAQPLKLKAPTVIIPNGLESSKYENFTTYGKFREKYALDDKRIILHLGRLNFVKGLDILVRAFSQVVSAREDAYLVLAGPDNEGDAEQVKGWLAQEGVEDKAIFAGILQGVDKLAALKDADIFALPSYSESFGIVVIEAMACGLPVVISDKVKIWREVERERAGLVTRCDADEVARAIVYLLDNPDYRQEMAEAGKALVSKDYRWDSIIHALLEAYRDVGRTR